MSYTETPPSQVEIQPKVRRKRWGTVIILFIVLVLICILSFCVLGVFGIVEGMKPKTTSVYYQGASIAHMLETCAPNHYYSWEEWMIPASGSNTLLSLNYSKSLPVPEAMIGFTLFIQVDPELVSPGQALSFTAPGVQPFLLQTRAPSMVCSSDLAGTVAILDITPTSIKTRLEVSGLIYGDGWEYNGDAEFYQAPLP